MQPRNNNILWVVLVIAIVAGIYFFTKKDNIPVDQEQIQEEQTQGEQLNQEESFFKTVENDDFYYQAPKDWIVSSQLNTNDCLLDGISNDTSDGHRMAGEIGIYPISCFDLSNTSGYKEITEKDGYYILAYYDKESGTTDEEISETKSTYQKVVDTFKIK